MKRILWPNFGKRGGLVTVVTIDRKTREVLMVAFANEEAFMLTLATGFAHYWSTSRSELWMKGRESGDVQLVSDVLIDCDGDALVYSVDQMGEGACHTKAWSCFFRSCLRGQLMEAPKMGKGDVPEEREAEVCSRLAGEDHRDESDAGMSLECDAPIDRERFKCFIHGMGMARPIRPS